MKYQFLKVILFLSVLMESTLSFGQDLKKDLEEMRMSYHASEKFACDITIKIFQGKSKNPVTVQKGKIRKKDKDFYSEMEGLKMLITKELMVVVNERQKDVMYRELKEQEYQTYLTKQMTYNLDSLSLSYDSIFFGGEKDGLKHYTVYTAKGIISKIDFYLNKSDKTLAKVIYDYNKKIYKEGFRTEILFNKPNNEGQDDNIFSVSKFIVRSTKGYQLQQAYNNYHLIQAGHEN